MVIQMFAKNVFLGPVFKLFILVLLSVFEIALMKISNSLIYMI